jgi:succinate dehydrogenase/fumarate reductase cytochrome b subunit
MTLGVWLFYAALILAWMCPAVNGLRIPLADVLVCLNDIADLLSV